MLKAKPFVKWAGGKRQIIDKLTKLVPEKYDTYYEPFIGGGALLFELSPKKAVINDYNKELMNVYKTIADDNGYEEVIKILNKYEIKHSEEFYYKIRDIDRDETKFKKLSNPERAARTIYLNKACFNGLYRVNSKGYFNVPFNKKQAINTYDGQNMTLAYVYFQTNDVKMLSTDFEEAVKDAKKGDFIYFDPPYDSENNNTFNDYTEGGFGKDEQIRLSEVFKDLHNRGCYVMLSNHNTTLINELYGDFNIHVIQAKRNINSKGNKRGKVEEVIITNYETSNDNKLD